MTVHDYLRQCAKVIMCIASSSLLAGESPATTASAHPQPAEGVKVVLELPPGPGNPRNSEGSFVTLRDGRIMYAYTRFTTAIRKGIPDSGEAEIVARFSSDGGLTWTAKDTLVVANEGALNVCCATLLRLQSGEIALFYLRKNSLVDCRPVMRRSFDEGATWSEPVECITDEVGYYVLNNDRVIQLRDGRLLFAVALSTIRDDKSFHEMAEVVTYYSDDNGVTWRRGQSRLRVRTPDGVQHPAQEPGVVELRDGRILLWIRTDAGCQYYCHSSDRGETWSEPQPSPFVSPLSPASVKRLPTGDLLALWNDHASRPEMKTRGPKWAHGARTPLAAALSRDDGATWGTSQLIEDEPDGWYCYAAIYPLDDGTVLLAYCAYEDLAHSRIVKVPLAWFH
ncbi:MAG: exo-alpha-sialidase [Kiritimatiellae bacterium]|nr:exo-alpha-sialidase [Kiritimatiellia bacterium]